MVHGTLRYDFPPLARHEVEELVDEEGGRQGLDAAPRDGDELAADRAAELAGVPGEGGDDAVEALQADRVGAAEQLRRVLAAVVHACKRAVIKTVFGVGSFAVCFGASGTQMRIKCH